MTAQATEILKYSGENLALCAVPLASYFTLAGVQHPFKAPSTGLWRGYVGTCKIIDDRLYLVDLTGCAKNGDQVGLDFLFPGIPNPVFAHWVNGTLRATRGELLKYVHMGFGSVYEEDLLFHFDDGILKSVTVRKNSLDDAEHCPPSPRRSLFSFRRRSQP